MQPIKNTSMLANKHPFTCRPVARKKKCSKFRVTDLQEKPMNFFMAPTGVDFSSRNTFTC